MLRGDWRGEEVRGCNDGLSKAGLCLGFEDVANEVKHFRTN